MSSRATVISIGAAVQDVFLTGKVLTPKREDGEWVEEFRLGSKMDVDGIVFSTGGGATNAAVTFARQGLSSSFMGKIAADPAGVAVKTALLQEKVDISLISYSKKYATGYSVLLLAPNGERTILTYRGASTNYRLENFKLEEAEAEWFYVSSLAGNVEVLEAIVDYAHKNGIKVAVNPGKGELKHTAILKRLLPKFDLVSLNKDEWQMLINNENVEVIVRTAASYVPYVVLTDGARGSVATDGTSLVRAGVYMDVPVVDRTGAGDAFSSGFVAGIIKGLSLEQSITLASANSTSVVRYIGAKEGILHHDEAIQPMELKVTKL